MLPIKEIYNYALQRMDKELMEKETSDNIQRLINNLSYYEIETNEIWFEYHSDKKIDLIFKIWDFEKIYMFYKEYVYSKNENSTVNHIFLMLKKLLEKREYINAISLEYDSNELVKENPIPCIFLEIDYEKIPKEQIKNVYKYIMELLDFSLKDISNEEFEKILDKIVWLGNQGYYLWNIGVMASRNSFLRLVWTPCSYKNSKKLAESLGWNLKNSELYKKYSNKTAEYILDCDLIGENYSNFGINIYQKDYVEKISLLSTLNEHRGLSESFIASLLKWQHKKVIYTNKSGLLIWQICHIKVKQNNESPKIYTRIEHYSLK